MEEKKKETGDPNNKPLNRTIKKIDPEKLKTYVKNHPDAIIFCNGKPSA